MQPVPDRRSEIDQEDGNEMGVETGAELKHQRGVVEDLHNGDGVPQF